VFDATQVASAAYLQVLRYTAAADIASTAA
jgi:hypothetical protein